MKTNEKSNKIATKKDILRGVSNMKIRRYYGHDCDSVNGFNNGNYIDEEYVFVSEEKDAYAKCLEFIEAHYVNHIDATEQDQGYELITGYYDTEGNEVSWEEFSNNEDYSYRYVHVNFEVIED